MWSRLFAWTKWDCIKWWVVLYQYIQLWPTKTFQKKNDVNAKQEENYTAILIFKLIFLIIIVSYNLFHYLVLCVSTICTDNCFNASWHVEYEFLAIIIWDAMDLNVLNSFDKHFGTGCQPYFSNAPIHFQ